MTTKKSKRKYGKIKKLIRRKFEESCNNHNTDFYATIGSRMFKEGFWHCDWIAWLDIPEWFNPSIRESAEKEIEPYLLEKYKEIQNVIDDTFQNVIQNEKEDKWFNFTYPLPPMFIAYPEYWDHVNGEFVKIKDARLMTDEEINELIEWYKIHAPTFVKQIEWEKDNWHKYFDFVGGSPFTDELFKCKAYNGIRVYGSFKFQAYGEFIPKEI